MWAYEMRKLGSWWTGYRQCYWGGRWTGRGWWCGDRTIVRLTFVLASWDLHGCHLGKPHPTKGPKRWGWCLILMTWRGKEKNAQPSLRFGDCEQQITLWESKLRSGSAKLEVRCIPGPEVPNGEDRQPVVFSTYFVFVGEEHAGAAQLWKHKSSLLAFESCDTLLLYIVFSTYVVLQYS